MTEKVATISVGYFPHFPFELLPGHVLEVTVEEGDVLPEVNNQLDYGTST